MHRERATINLLNEDYCCRQSAFKEGIATAEAIVIFVITPLMRPGFSYR
jgi:hypothetical protein